MSKKQASLSIVGVLSGFALACSGGSAWALDINGAVNGIQNPFTFVPSDPNRKDVIGYSFNLSVESIINALGVYDIGNNGLNSSYEVAIFNSVGQIVSSIATVESGSTNLLDGGFRWAGIPEITLQPGSYVVGAFGAFGGSGGDGFASFQNNQIPSFSVINGVIFGESREKIDVSSLVFPNDTECNNTENGFCNGIWGANFSVVQRVPGPLPLLGVAAAFGYSRKLRNRVKTSKTTAYNRPEG